MPARYCQRTARRVAEFAGGCPRQGAGNGFQPTEIAWGGAIIGNVGQPPRKIKRRQRSIEPSSCPPASYTIDARPLGRGEVDLVVSVLPRDSTADRYVRCGQAIDQSLPQRLVRGIRVSRRAPEPRGEPRQDSCVAGLLGSGVGVGGGARWGATAREFREGGVQRLGGCMGSGGFTPRHATRG